MKIRGLDECVSVVARAALAVTAAGYVAASPELWASDGVDLAVEAVEHCIADTTTPTATKIVVAGTPNVSMASDGSEWLERAFLVELRGVDHTTPAPYWMRTYGVYLCERMQDTDGNEVDVWRSTPRGSCEINVTHAYRGLTVTAWEIASVQSSATVELAIPELREEIAESRGVASIAAPDAPFVVVVAPDDARSLRGKAIANVRVERTLQDAGRYSCAD